jgi:hypothetical protein
MRLNLPGQNAPSATSTTSGSRKLKQFLPAQPGSATADLAEQIFLKLRNYDRQTPTGKKHLKNMEILSLLSAEFFNILENLFCLAPAKTPITLASLDIRNGLSG